MATNHQISDPADPFTTAATEPVFDEQAFRRGLRTERLKPADVLSFLNALPRRIRTILDHIDDEERRHAEERRVNAIVDRLDELISELRGEGYPLDPAPNTSSPNTSSPNTSSRDSALERLESAVAEATQRLAGLPPDALSDDHEDSVIPEARQAVSDLAVLLRSLSDAADLTDAAEDHDLTSPSDPNDPATTADRLDPLAAPMRTEKADNAEIMPGPDRSSTIEQARRVVEDLEHSQHRPPEDQQIVPGSEL